MKIYTKESIIERFHEIREMGWIPSGRPNNDGGVGNTLEDLLGIEENNLPIPNAAEWELKAKKATTNALTTLIHMEPSPQALKFVPAIFLPHYGWAHKEAGAKYPATEMSFRQTIHGQSRSDRGFKVVVDRAERKVLISFDPDAVGERHADWLASVERRVDGPLGELDPQPYWGFDDLGHRVGSKLTNCFFVEAETKKEDDLVYFKYSKILMLRQFNIEDFVDAIEDGNVFVDFDARTGHNHGTKFRTKKKHLPELYAQADEVL